jgi:predicted lipase
LQQLYPTYAVKTTGHSLGAALTSLTTLMLLKNGIQIERSITFGQPRVGNDKYAHFVDSLDYDQQRVVHMRDIYPHTPFEGFPTYYLQSKTEIFEQDDGSYTVCSNSAEDPACSDQFAATELNDTDHWMYMGMCIGPDCPPCS